MNFLEFYFLFRTIYSPIYLMNNYKLKKVDLYPIANSKNYYPYGSRPYSNSTNKIITGETINKVIANKNVSITQQQLDQLLAIRGVTFDLPMNSDTLKAYYSLVGHPHTRKRKAGVYIWTDLTTGYKNVGSSNSLY